MVARRPTVVVWSFALCAVMCRRDFLQSGPVLMQRLGHTCSQGCTCTPPRAVKKKFRLNLQEKCVSAPPGHEVHPQARTRVNF